MLKKLPKNYQWIKESIREYTNLIDALSENDRFLKNHALLYLNSFESWLFKIEQDLELLNADDTVPQGLLDELNILFRHITFFSSFLERKEEPYYHPNFVRLSFEMMKFKCASLEKSNEDITSAASILENHLRNLFVSFRRNFEKIKNAYDPLATALLDVEADPQAKTIAQNASSMNMLINAADNLNRMLNAPSNETLADAIADYEISIDAILEDPGIQDILSSMLPTEAQTHTNTRRRAELNEAEKLELSLNAFKHAMQQQVIEQHDIDIIDTSLELTEDSTSRSQDAIVSSTEQDLSGESKEEIADSFSESSISKPKQRHRRGGQFFRSQSKGEEKSLSRRNFGGSSSMSMHLPRELLDTLLCEYQTDINEDTTLSRGLTPGI